jgi:hypothetical protein
VPLTKLHFILYPIKQQFLLGVAGILCCHESPDFLPCLYLGRGGGVNDATGGVTWFNIYIQYVNNQILCIACILQIKLSCLPSFSVAENGACDVLNVGCFILHRS